MQVNGTLVSEYTWLVREFKARSADFRTIMTPKEIIVTSIRYQQDAQPCYAFTYSHNTWLVIGSFSAGTVWKPGGFVVHT